jgi:cyanophycinase-like exopeptidase
MARLLVIMGSGETAPTMVRPHRALLERIGEAPAVLLDTPYGFQENADDISARAVGYFDASVGRKITVASWRRREQAPAPRERALASLRDAGWIFAGPGSPTYALRQWRETPVPPILADRLRCGGAVVFASAAALTLGSHTVPVYEIYKAGIDPVWVEGLDLVREATGLPAVVIPHYDNAEGGHHDTRFCYLGERRLSTMEAELPEESFILGVDEHTAAILDIDACTVSVVGNGTMTIRRRGVSVVHESGALLSFDDLLAAPGSSADDATTEATGGASAASTPAADTGTSADPSTTVSPLRAETDRLLAANTAAIAAADVETAVGTILDLDDLLNEWAADLSDDAYYARSVLRQMVVRLGDLATSGDAATDTLGAVMDVVIAVRKRARDAKDFATSDWIRDGLGGLDIEIRDTPDGATWHRG